MKITEVATNDLLGQKISLQRICIPKAISGAVDKEKHFLLLVSLQKYTNKNCYKDFCCHVKSCDPNKALTPVRQRITTDLKTALTYFPFLVSESCFYAKREFLYIKWMFV